MENKSNTVKISFKLIKGKEIVKESSVGNEYIPTEYYPQLLDDQPFTSLELFLISLSSCIASLVLIFLTKMKKPMNGLDISAIGTRRQKHPTGFKTIYIEFNFKSLNIMEKDMDKIIKLSKELYCPMCSMLKDNVEIALNYNILNE